MAFEAANVERSFDGGRPSQTMRVSMISLHGMLAYWLSTYPWLVFILGILASASLFALRSYLLSIYGLVEVAAGLILLRVVEQSIRSTNVFNADFSMDFDVFRVGIQLTAFIGGVFAIIRGIDNITRGWSSTRATWSKFFPLSAKWR